MLKLKKSLICLTLSLLLLNNIGFWFAQDLLTWEELDSEILSGTDDSIQEEDELSPEVQKKANTINNFEGQKMDMIDELYESDSATVFFDTDKAQEQLNDLSDQFKDISKDFTDIRKKKTKILDQYNEIRETVQDTLDDINTAKTEMNNRVIKIKLYTKKLVSIKKDLEEIQADMDLTKENISRYTTALYKINNDFYWEDLYIDDIKLLVRSEDNIAQSLNTEDLIKAFTLTLDELMSVLKTKQEKYIQYTKQLNDLRVKYKYEVKSYDTEIQHLTEQKKYLIQMLTFLKSNKDETDKEFLDLYESKKSLKTQIVNLLSLTNKNIWTLELATWFDQNMSDFFNAEEQEDWDKFFSWPILPVSRISTYYDDPDYEKDFWVLHKAVDLVVPQWTEIYAPANGVVYKVIDQDWPWVNWMIVLHKYGYVTVYLHLNKILVKEWDFVKRWDIMAISGWKPWTRWAWFLSTWPHLHFEILKNWEYIDPLTTLDLSIFRSKGQLISTYSFKYIKDKFSRNIDLSDIEYMAWNNLYERRVKFLTTYWAWPFKDIALWEDASKWKNVDIDLAICIWFAETWLGHNMTSDWNIGNVWNNDRWNRKAFPDAYRGARSIFNALTNEYLWKHTTIDQLSRYWNATGSIYASSSENWQKNVVKCLTKIKWYRVPENYSFRINVESWEDTD